MTTESTNTSDTPEQANTEIELNQAEQQNDEPIVAEVVAEEVEPEAVAALSAEEQKIIELEQALATAKATVDNQKDMVIRAKAEVDNMRRRAAQDVDKAKKFALEKFATEMLAVVDNLERGLANIDAEQQQVIFEGIDLTLQGLNSGLEKFGVKAVDPQDKPFNPEFHQAMSMQEVEGVEPNTVIAVMQKGYELNGRLIRPAMVMVSKAKA